VLEAQGLEEMSTIEAPVATITSIIPYFTMSR
jgi:hypothetical protein